MHILVIILGAVAGAAFWYYRLKAVREAGSEIIDAVGRTKGKYRRNKIKTATEQSPVAAIDNAITAAATVIYFTLENANTVPAQDKVIMEHLAALSDPVHADEAAVYGKWAASQGIEYRTAAKMLCNKLNGWLSKTECDQLLSILDELNASELFAVHSERLLELKKRLIE